MIRAKARSKALSILFALVSLPGASSARADTVYLKDKQEVRGVIVEEFADRYVLKTLEGENPIMKAQVAAVKYDDPELSYYQLGRDLQRVGRLHEALKAYQKSAELRPSFQAAQEAAFGVQRTLDRQDEPELMAEVRQKQAVLEQEGKSLSGQSAAQLNQVPDLFDIFEKRFGVVFRREGEWVVVSGVRPQSAASSSDLRSGDRVLAVSGEPLGHLKAAEAAQRLEAHGNELQLSIEREVMLDRLRVGKADRWGMRMDLSYDGLRISRVDSGGPAQGRCQVGDFVVALNHQPTRYMAMAEVERRMSEGNSLVVLVQRQVFIREQSLAEGSSHRIAP